MPNKTVEEQKKYLQNTSRHIYYMNLTKIINLFLLKNKVLCIQYVECRFGKTLQVLARGGIKM